VVNGLIESMADGEVVTKTIPKEKDPYGFEENRKPEDRFQDNHEIRLGGMKESRLHDLPSLEGNPPSHHDEEDRGKGDDPQAAHLKKDDGDHLADEGEALPDVDGGQPGHAHGGG
jgi:hypothetical protein